VNQPAQVVAILAKRGGALELRRTVTAVLALAAAHEQLRARQAVAAENALRAAQRLNFGQAIGADRQTGDVIERSATELAIGGKDDGKNTSQQYPRGARGPYSSLASTPGSRGMGEIRNI
jgi:hypothetical protein